MVRRIVILACVFALAFTLHPSGQTRAVKALVGGTLIDGNGSRPVQNSVVIVEGDRVRAVGQVGSLQVPAGAEVISTEGMTVLPGLWDITSTCSWSGTPTTTTGTRRIRPPSSR